LLYRFCSLSNLNMNQPYITYYSCLENPIAKEPGRLQSMGSQRVGHDWIDLACRAFLLYLFGSPFVPLIQRKWQKQSQYCKVSIYQFKIKLKKKRKLEWVAVSFSRKSSQPRDWTLVSCLADGFFTTDHLGIMVIKCISVIIDGFEHLFMWLLAIYLCLWNNSENMFLIFMEVFIFPFLSYKNALCILDIL